MRKSVLRKWMVTGMALVLSAALMGCGSSSMNDSAMDMSASVESDAFYGSVMEESFTESASTSNATSEVSVEDTNRKLIKRVNMTVETEEFDDFITQMDAKISQIGGYKEQFTIEGNTNDRYAYITARIPKAQLDAFLEVVEGVSNITYRHETIEDVTLEYVDLESHKKMLLAEQERLLELMEQANDITDIIAIENRLTDVQYQLESMESQLRTFDNQIEYSTVYLDVYEVVRYTPQEPEGVWERISTGFSENLYEVGEDIKDGFVSFIVNIPNLVITLIGIVFYVAIAVLVIKLIIKLVVKLNGGNKNKPQNNMNSNTMQPQIQPDEKDMK